MKKDYRIPELQVVHFEAEDVITVSSVIVETPYPEDSGNDTL